MVQQLQPENVTYEDKVLDCVDCGDVFVFEAGEAYFFARKGFPEPRRCPTCREQRRIALNREAVIPPHIARALLERPGIGEGR